MTYKLNAGKENNAMKTLFRNGRIYDGTGADGFVGDILVEDDRILEVAPHIDCEDAETVDLTGLSVSAGFFDGHSHNDFFAIKKEPLKYFEPFIRQGITSFVAGNCGMSAFGFEPDTPHLDRIGAGLFGYKGDTTGVYPDAASFFNAVDGHMPCNLAALVGHCTARASVSGYENRKLTEDENRRMLALMEQALKEGACGASLGLMYEPGLYAQSEELRGVALLCDKYDVPMTVHPRAESKVSMAYPQLLGRPHILRALDELAEIGRGTKLKLQYSHCIFVGRSSLKLKDDALAIMRKMREDGMDVRFDIYNETLGTSVITVILPDWYRALTPDQKKSPVNKLKLQVLCSASIALLGFGWKDILVAYAGQGNERYEGKTIDQIAKETKQSCLDAYIEVCEASEFKGRVNMGPYSTPEIIHEFEKSDLCNFFMTDAWVEEYGIQNPAIYDCHPKFLRDAVTGEGASMPVTIRKMTGAVADRFGVKDRGYLKPGCHADLTVFDEEKVRQAVPDQEKSFGIEQVYINGRRVLKDGVLDTGALRTSGRAIRVMH